MSSLIKIDGVKVSMATSYEKVVANFHANKGYSDISECSKWVKHRRIAVVGGGPSLKDTLPLLLSEKYDDILACGSVHDYLIENDVIPTCTIVCDPDAIMGNYLEHLCTSCTYFMATQCDPYLIRRINSTCNVYTFNAGGDEDFNKAFDRGTFLSGGCTVGTRGIMLALGMGYSNIELFGFDTCIANDNTHHAYSFSSLEETIGKITEISLEPDGKKYRLADYMVGQLFDFKNILVTHYSRMNVTIHGEGILSDYIEICRQKANSLIEKGECNGA